MTNEQLGQLIGCTHSMASRLRAGKRLPGPAVMSRISRNLGVPADEVLKTRERGADAFGRLLRRRIAEIDRGATAPAPVG